MMLIIVASVRMASPERFIKNWDDIKGDTALRVSNLDKNDETSLESKLAQGFVKFLSFQIFPKFPKFFESLVLSFFSLPCMLSSLILKFLF